MKFVFYVIWLALGVVISPFVGLVIASYTFFVTSFHFVKGVNEGLKKLLFVEESVDKPVDIWDKHILRMNKSRVDTKKKTE